ncbi:beta-galactosidase [Dactylosporangium sp. AC04546]|uniref:beta-galactosidase n=1 Tax=Dactylosporangium sp. AC04546 TaxID=2862460 RepID=UPI001EDCBCAD|nr:beta-galactosidase [Dactylosporangium sp. AC04546]WVK89731.1 beta-galactosidase [Dactylosporangium sp. AC04546]
MLFGAAYYPEYEAVDRLDADIELMRAAGVNYVRVGESTWHLWEPIDGQFQFDWITRVVDRCHAAGISAIVGTPTYAIPAWLARRYPEILAQTGTGTPLTYGGRQNVDITHGAYLFHAERVIRAAVGHFAGHAGVIGFQVDNETGVYLLHNPGVRERFADHLKATYGSLDAVNEAWGTNHWSLGLGDWADLWPADHNSSPGYNLAWRRFQTSLVTEFLAWQAGIVRELARPDQFVTHCTVGGHELIRPAGNARAVARLVDIPGVNVYYSTQDTLELPDHHTEPPVPSWAAGVGVWALYLQADMARVAAKNDRFLVLESNASNAGYPHENHPAYDGQWRQAALALAARGARGMGYWHWHSCHTGKEIYWRGVLGHDYQPGRPYREIAALGAELATLAPLLGQAEPDAEVAFLYSQDSKYVLQFQPPLADPVTGRPDPASYERIFNTFYRGYFDAGFQMACIDLEEDRGEDLSRWPVLVVPAGYVLADADASRLVDYAAAGGHLVLTPRTGYVDEHGRARTDTAPGPLSVPAGVAYQEFTNLRTAVPVVAAAGEPVASDGASATYWADLLRVTTAEPVLYYDHPAWGQYPAVTTHRWFAGRITWVGTLPDPVLARDLARWTAAAAGITPLWTELPTSVRTDSASLPGGRKLWFVGNWSGQPVSVRLPFTARHARTGDTYPEGHQLQLAAWDTTALLTA